MDVEDEEKPSTSEAQGDQVVSEMDLFVVRDPTQRKVLLLQYPMKRSGCLENEESDGIVKASYKKQSGKLELQIPLETHSDVYDRTRGAELGSTNQEKSSSNNKEDLMNYSTMTSTSIKGHAASSYALGFINNGKLHITPVGGVNQMRHSFKYISGKACGVSVTPGKTADQGESSQSESETEQGAQTIRVKFTKDEQNARNVKKRNRRLFGHEDDENDPWVPLIHRKAESTLKDKMSLISVSDAEVAVPQVDRKFNDSVRMIVPNDSLPEKSPVVEGAPLITDLHSLTLGEQTRELMRKGTLMEFEEILSRLSVGTKRGVEVETKIIDILTEIASLVQGCWVINSDIAFKPGEKSGSTGMDLKDMSKARDYVLYRMSHGESVTRKEVLSRFNVAPEDLLLALRQIGTVEQQRGWRFKRPPDTKFIKKHHELVKAERLKWEQKWKALNAEFPVDVKRERSKSGSKKASPSRQRRRTSSNRSTSISSDTDIIKTPLIDTVIGSPRHSVHSAEPSTSNGTAGRDKPLLSSEATDELKKLIYQLLCEKSVRSFTSLRRALALKLSEADASYQLHQTEFSDEILHEAAEKSGAKIIMSQNSDPIVVFGGRGSLPEIREVLVNFLQEKNGFRLASFKKACAEKVIEMPNDDEIRAMLQDYCSCKNGIFSLNPGE